MKGGGTHRAGWLILAGAGALIFSGGAGKCWGAWGPGLPDLSLSVTCAGVTASITTSVYAEPLALVTDSATIFGRVGPIRSWGLSVVPMTAATTAWTVRLQGSNDNAVWTDLGAYDWQQGSGGGMVWFDHRTVKRARLYVSRLSGVLTATAYGEP